ncbi:polysaccharide biosynthesis/export family protein [Stratiformator vulcanicus]|uniref:polysaccharide biosynthesis/export family protein n=1 Tax=Stratiformator vulcanicus TaxID=2527980 RepID=UPI0028773667|nr:polysaccharide biosynthesis/export family protein [Stratiformator vulcanicus]
MSSIVLLVALAVLPGCAGFKPVRGIPVQELDLASCAPNSNRSARSTLDLSVLRQVRPEVHRVDSGDVLGIFVEGVLGNDRDVPPINAPPGPNSSASLGYPIKVLDDGTIHLPLVRPIYVRGLTLFEVEQAIRETYTGRAGLLRPGAGRILVTLQRPREFRILVIRQEAGNPLGNLGAAQSVNFETDKRGTGRIVTLPIYENDVLHALAETGGLPGLDAENAIYIIRQPRPAPLEPVGEFIAKLPPASNPMQQPIQSASYLQQTAHQDHLYPIPAAPGHPSFVPPPPGPADGHGVSSDVPLAGDANAAEVLPEEYPDYVQQAAAAGSQVIRIPLRVLPGEPLCFGPEDIVLYDGDIVFIEARDQDFFFTGGLLGNAQIVLPRDYDLDVLGAIALAEQASDGPYPTPAVGGVSVLNQDVSAGASKVVVHRPLPGGGRLPIEVDLYRALNDPNENLIVEPGDRVFLRYNRYEAFVAFCERHLIEGAVIGGASALTFGN